LNIITHYTYHKQIVLEKDMIVEYLQYTYKIINSFCSTHYLLYIFFMTTWTSV